MGYLELASYTTDILRGSNTMVALDGYVSAADAERGDGPSFR
jgi:hypothetical protein